MLTVLVSPNVQKRARQASEPPIISRTSIDDKRRSIPPPSAAASEVTLADGTTLPLIGGTSVAHQDRSDLEVTFAPAGAIAAGLMRACDCFQQRALAGRERRVPALDCAPRLSLRRPPPLSRRRKAGEALVGERLAACVNIRSG